MSQDHEHPHYKDAPPSAPVDWREHGVKVINGDQLDSNTAQTPGMNRAAAINAARVGAQKIWAGTVTIHPNAKTGAHHHGALESVIYVVRGQARMRWGEHLEFTAEAGPGDFIFVPPYVPHQEINASTDDPLECVLVRSDNEAVVVNLNIDAVEAARNGLLGRSDSQASARSLNPPTRLMTPTASPAPPPLVTLYADADRRQSRRLGVGADRVSPLSAAARHGAARVRLRPAPRGRRGPHRRDRRRHAQADAGRQAAARRWASRFRWAIRRS